MVVPEDMGSVSNSAIREEYRWDTRVVNDVRNALERLRTAFVSLLNIAEISDQVF